MPSLRHRVFAVVLALALLASLAAVAHAADEGAADAGAADAAPSSPAFAPPSLDVALAALAGGVPVAGEAARAGELTKVRLPACEIGDQRTRYGKVRHWRKTLLDTNLKLRRAYKPRDLVPVSRAGIAGSGLVRKVMIRDLRALARAARAAGKPLAVRSAYRSYSYQARLFDSYVRDVGYSRAITFSARAGHSEHQLGTTIDFTTAPSVPLRTTFGESPSGKWLARNGWRFGFIMSYPKGKKRASCYGYEPWHWRYFGRERAREIHESGQVPRRYLYENFESTR